MKTEFGAILVLAIFAGFCWSEFKKFKRGEK